MEKENKGKFIFIITSTRSLGTIFSRVLLQYNPKQTLFLIDRFPWFCVERFFNYSEEEKKKFIEETDTLLENNLSLGKTVIWKDIAHMLTDHFSDYFDKLVKKYSPYLLFLERHPKPQHLSFKTQLVEEEKKNPDLKDHLLSELKIDQLKHNWIVYEKYKGYVIITEKLQEYPEEEFEKVFNYVGLEFKKGSLNFEPFVLDESIDKESFKESDYHWYVECVNSSSFSKNKPNVDDGNLEEEWENVKVNEAIKYYNCFQEEYNLQK